MRKRDSKLKIVFAIAAMASIAGCGEGNSNAPMVDSNGKHPAGWVKSHKSVAATSPAACDECHGSDQTGGISRVSCMSATPLSGFACHASNPVAQPSGCVSCHSVPPNGTTVPNRTGAHAAHLAVPGITCATCHSGAGYGTASHAKTNASGDIAAFISPLDNSFQAKTFTTFGFDAAGKTCSGIICHGGLTTPAWGSTTAIACVDCHTLGSASQEPQFNSFFSGRISVGNGIQVVNLHQIHLLERLPGTSTLVSCIDCHDSAKVTTTHQTGLTTPAFDAAAATTIGGGSSKISSYTPYTGAVPSGNCTSTCHGARFWINP